MIIILFFIILIYFIFNRNLSKENKNNKIIVLLRIKNDNLVEIKKSLDSYKIQNIKNKRLIILNDQTSIDKFFIDYCNLNDDTDLYSSLKINPYTLNLILKEAKIQKNQIIVPIDSNDYFNNNDVLYNIEKKKINSSKIKNFKNGSIQFFYFKN